MAEMETATLQRPRIGAEEVRQAAQILKKYKQGKAHLESRIIDNEQFWKMRHWQQMGKNGQGGNPADPQPTSGWLVNCILSKHADAMDCYPEPTVLPREEGDRMEAGKLTKILPVVLKQNQFKRTYSDAWWYKLKSGCGTYQRVAIEVKSSVFKKTDTVADSLARALSKAFARYGLLVKVVPIRDDKHFWSLVSDRKQFPRGFNKLCVKFPQINDPKVTEAMRRANIIYREMFHSNLVIIQESSEGEKLSFNEEDEKQREYMKLCAENADSIQVSPIGARPITLGGKTAKTQQMTDAERKNIEDVNHEIGLFDGDPIQSTQSFMDKAYGKA